MQYQAINIWPLFLIGYSIVVGPVLGLAYLRSELFPKTLYSVASGIALIACLCLAQFYHLMYFLTGMMVLENPIYLTCLFVAPTLFFYFARSGVLVDAGFSPVLVLWLLPCLMPLFMPVSLALPILLFLGAGFSLWLSSIAYSFRHNRKQHRFELLFSVFITAAAAVTCVLGALIPWTDERYFIQVYSQSIGIAYVFITFALIAIPGFVTDLFDQTRTKYAASTLNGVDIESVLQELDKKLTLEKVFRDEELSLGTLATELELSTHQLSELVNTHLNMPFSHYIRSHRIAEAKTLLAREPKRSVLSVALEVGYRSQSTFYAAFKEEVGVSPGDYRSKQALE